jgi:hypothetical protein
VKEIYLGDGVYATHDGYSVWLDCRGQSGLSVGPSGTPAICLEPFVIERLIQWLKTPAEQEAEGDEKNG